MCTSAHIHRCQIKKLDGGTNKQKQEGILNLYLVFTKYKIVGAVMAMLLYSNIAFIHYRQTPCTWMGQVVSVL